MKVREVWEEASDIGLHILVDFIDFLVLKKEIISYEDDAELLEMIIFTEEQFKPRFRALLKEMKSS